MRRETVSGTTWYVGGYEYEVEEGSGVVTQRLTHSVAGVPVAVDVKVSGEANTRQWLFGDHLGSVSAFVEEGSGDAVSQRFYPFGHERLATSTGVLAGSVLERGGVELPTDVGFTGQVRDDSTGLLFYNARYYDPVVGRFTQADTIIPNPANPVDLNRYAYVRNSPLIHTDPSGHETCSEKDGGGTVCWSEADMFGLQLQNSTPLNPYDPYADPANYSVTGSSYMIHGTGNGLQNHHFNQPVIDIFTPTIEKLIQAFINFVPGIDCVEAAVTPGDQHVSSGMCGFDIATGFFPVGWADNLAGAIRGAAKAQRLGPFSRVPSNVNAQLPPNAPQIPDNARIRDFHPSQTGGAQHGVEFVFDNADGVTVRIRIHGPDGTAPPGSNAATGDVLRIQVGSKYMDVDGNLHPRGVTNPRSPFYDEVLANELHIPWQP